MTIEEIRNGAPQFANHYYIDGENILYFDKDEGYGDLFLFFPSLSDFFIIDDFPLDKLKPL